MPHKRQALKNDATELNYLQVELQALLSRCSLLCMFFCYFVTIVSSQRIPIHRLPAGANVHTSGLRLPLENWVTKGSDQYYMTFLVGTPPQEISLLADTGSELVWMQSSTCKICFEGPGFYYKKSETYTKYDDLSNECLLRSYARVRDRSCPYDAHYADNSYSSGFLGADTFTFGKTSFRLSFGCGVENVEFSEGHYYGASGILGMNNEPLSFITQITGGKTSYSYCLVHEFSKSPEKGYLDLDDPIPDSAFSVPMLVNQMDPAHHYVPFEGILINGSDKIVGDEFKFTRTSGVLLDTGSVYTYFPSRIYKILCDRFDMRMQELNGYTPRRKGWGFDLCYSVSDSRPLEIPTIEFDLGSGVLLNVEPLRRGNGKTWCFQFLNSDYAKLGLFSIIGSRHQMGTRVFIDATNRRIGFQEEFC